MKNEILVHEAICVFGEKPQTPPVKRAAKSVRRAGAVLSFKEWDVDGASRALDCDERAVARDACDFRFAGIRGHSRVLVPRW